MIEVRLMPVQSNDQSDRWLMQSVLEHSSSDQVREVAAAWPTPTTLPWRSAPPPHRPTSLPTPPTARLRNALAWPLASGGDHDQPDPGDRPGSAPSLSSETLGGTGKPTLMPTGTWIGCFQTDDHLT